MNKAGILVVSTLILGAFLAGMLSDGIDLDMKPEVASIPIKGVISPGSSASPSDLNSLIKKASSQGVEGFLFEINSPGGTVVASRRMYKIIGDLEKPTVCLMEDVAASGAYWASAACDEIVADPLTVTGSIGVTASYLEYSEYMKEEGIDYVRFVEGDLKDMGSPYRNITDEEEEIFNRSVRKVWEEFVQNVNSSRGLNKSQMEKISTGRTFLGSDAKEVGLVDHLGGREEAKKILEERIGEKIELKEYKKKTDMLDLIGASAGESNGMESVLNSIERRVPVLLSVYL